MHSLAVGSGWIRQLFQLRLTRATVRYSVADGPGAIEPRFRLPPRTRAVVFVFLRCMRVGVGWRAGECFLATYDLGNLPAEVPPVRVCAHYPPRALPPEQTHRFQPDGPEMWSAGGAGTNWPEQEAGFMARPSPQLENRKKVKALTPPAQVVTYSSRESASDDPRTS